MYWYHPDYLGSVEFVTDMRGMPYQYFLNTPFGENLENQTRFNWKSFTSRYRFNAKEWDEETGNYYYGARYYDPKMSVWLSVDPKAHWYPSHSPYNFSLNNPVNLVDPNGMWVEGGGFFNNLFYSDEKVVQKMAQKHADDVGGELMTVEGGFRVLEPSSPSTTKDNNTTINVDIKDFYIDRLSGDDPATRLGSLGIGINFEYAIPGSLTLDGKPAGNGLSFDLMADADNSLNLLKTTKTPDGSMKNQFGLSIGLQFSLTTGTGGNPNPLNGSLIGAGTERGAASGPLGYSQSTNIDRTYQMHTVPLNGRFSRSLDFGITRWRTNTQSIWQF